MHEYLKKISKINTTHPDDSDIIRFFSKCEEYLIKQSNKEEYKSDLFELLKSDSVLLKSKGIILLSYFDAQINIDFTNEEYLESYLFYLSVNKRYLNYKEEIIKLLYNSCWINNLYNILKNNEFNEEKKKFIELHKNINDKLMLMRHTSYFYTIEYFVEHLGSDNSFTCFLAYELLHLYFLKTNNFNFTKVKVKNQNNFLFYSFDFLKEREEIFDKIKENDLFSIKLILSKYLTDVSNLEINNKIKRLMIHQKKQIVFTKEESDEDFDYLFDNSSKKEVCDCFE
ncbi:hypothetical protein H311_03664 [Anncaliia algerae PRA109]|nr:hypothetical protein H311_03664 [Anncaliia algerae PRA109]